METELNSPTSKSRTVAPTQENNLLESSPTVPQNYKVISELNPTELEGSKNKVLTPATVIYKEHVDKSCSTRTRNKLKRKKRVEDTRYLQQQGNNLYK